MINGNPKAFYLFFYLNFQVQSSCYFCDGKKSFFKKHMHNIKWEVGLYLRLWSQNLGPLSLPTLTYALLWPSFQKKHLSVI